MPRRAPQSDSEQLARWVFGIARIFGHWPFNSNIQLERLTISATDWLRFMFIIATYSACIWFEATLNRTSFVVGSTLVFNLFMLDVILYLLSAMLSVIICMHNRHSLLMMISIFRDFDQMVRIITFYIIEMSENIANSKIYSHSQVDNSASKKYQRNFKVYFMCSICAASIMICGVLTTVFVPYFWLNMKTHTYVEILRKLMHVLIVTLAMYTQLAIGILYAYFLLNIRIRYRLLYLALCNVDGTQNYIQRLDRSATEGLIHLLNTIAKQYDHLTDGVEQINKCFSFQVSYHSSTCFILIFNVFYSRILTIV